MVKGRENEQIRENDAEAEWDNKELYLRTAGEAHVEASLSESRIAARSERERV